MFKKVFNIVLFLMMILAADAQNEIAPNFKLTDIYGNFYNLYNDYAAEKYVFLDFFTNSCTFCQYYAPKIDSVYKFFGCGCGQIDFFALNLSENSTDEMVLDFITRFGITFNPVSAQGGSAYTAGLYEVEYTPYFVLISPDTLFVMRDFYFNTAQWLIDTLLSYGIVPAECRGTELKYFEVKDQNELTVAVGHINQEEALISVDLPDTVANRQLSAFVITSSNAKLVDEQGDTLLNTFLLDNLSDTLKLKVIAQTDTLFKIWNVVFDTLYTAVENDVFLPLFPNPTVNVLSIDPFFSHAYAYIYDLNGKIVALKKIVDGKINISALPKGVYVLYIKKSNKVFAEKFVKF